MDTDSSLITIAHTRASEGGQTTHRSGFGQVDKDGKLGGVFASTADQKRELARLLDISDVRTILAMFKIKEQYAQPLTEKELEVKHEIDAARCVFQVD